MIEAHGLRKHYGQVEAVRGIDLTIPAGGGCFGLLGPNGAGKTTTMRMITGLTTVSAGTLTVFGRPVAAMGRVERRRIGLVAQDNTLDPDVSAQKNLEIYGGYYGMAAAAIAERVPKLLEFMQLTEKAGARVSELSGGMKRRLVIARALISDPELVVLDEPTTGLDPQARVLIWKQLIRLKAEGKTLLLTTHYMDEAQRLCDHIVVIDGGQILDQGTPQELIARHVKGHVFELHKPLPAQHTLDGLEREDIGDAILFYVEDPVQVRHGVPQGTPYLHRMANLEDVFLRLTGRQLREG